MRAILLISSVLVLANARPDVSHGYQYDTPQDNYQGAVPDQSNNYGSSSETLPNFVPVQTHSGPGVPPVYPDTQQPENFVPTGPSDVQLQGVPQFAQTAPEQQYNVENQVLPSGSATYGSSDAPQQQSFSTSYDANPSGVPQQQVQSSFGGSQQVQSSFGGSQQVQSSFGGSQQQVQSSFGGSQQQSVSSQNTFSSQASQSDELPPIITKHFYVHAAPEEPEESQGPRFVNIGRKQKNYKIIFIKAPTYGFNSQIIPVVQPSEEKTIVYVLSKKPSFNQDISLPPAPVTEPSKPEVFFIKYKTEGEAQEAQQKIQGAYETANLGGSNDNVVTNVANSFGNAVNNFQNQASSTFNTAVGQAQGVAGGFASNIGSLANSFGSQSSAVAQSQTVNDEQQQNYSNAASSDSAISANLVEASTQEQQQYQQQQQQPNEEYLPPNQHQ